MMDNETKFVVNKKKQIIKSNNLIESSYKLSVQEQRLIYLASTKLKTIMIAKDLNVEQVKSLIKSKDFDLIEINAKDFKSEFGLSTGRIYRELIDASDRLFNRRIIYMDDEGRITKKRWVITCTYDLNNGRVLLQFHPDLITDLLIFKSKFTILELENSKAIKTTYAFRFYELLKQYSNIGYRTFELDNLRFVLGLEDNEYPKYCNLKQRVISPVVKELNDSSDIYVELEETKLARKVIKIKFYIRTKSVVNKKSIKQLSIFDEVCIDNDDNMISKVRDIIGNEFSPQQITEIIDVAYNTIENDQLDIDILDYVKNKKSVVDVYAKKHNIDNKFSVIKSAIINNWNVTKSVVNNKNRSKFNDYEQRKYDGSNGALTIDDLEKKLLGWD
jgi:plasmid replication initiation protein